MTETRLSIWLAETANLKRRSLAARHRIFCEGDGGEVLERCHVVSPSDPHDEYDLRPFTQYLGATLNGRDIATARIILGDLNDLPTGHLLGRLEQPPVTSAGVWYSEPSRLGLEHACQGTAVGRLALLRLIGLIAETSIMFGFDHYLLTLRVALMRAISWFPWELAPPIDYPPGEGGPITAEPIWLATLNLHELPHATSLLMPSAYPLMFPDEPTWVDPGQIRPDQELVRLVHSNRAQVRAAQRDWKAGRLTLAKLAPAKE